MVHASAALPHTPPDPRRWRVLTLISVAQFMLILDVTVVNVALPAIGADLDLGRTALTWVVAAYTLLFGGLMLLGGRLADLLGARRLMLAGLALFTATSLACALAQEATVLLGGRIGQGVGAALLSPAALSTITTIFHGTERHRALGVWAALGGAGSAAGVLLGGILTAGPGWRWIFLINVPAGLAVLAALAALPMLAVAGTTRPSGERVDLLGALLVTTATGALIYGLVHAGEDGWASLVTVTALATALVLYALFFLRERSVPSPSWPSPRSGWERCSSRRPRPRSPWSLRTSRGRPPAW
ncbi:MFS transporter [Streptosporangium roseum]|uniref:MFS transporter n=1 Tax=Streptosporangium roseum TaxID=2001 RepID=UPI0033193C88